MRSLHRKHTFLLLLQCVSSQATYVEVEGAQLKVVTSKKTHAEALADCAADGAVLAVPKTKAIYDHVLSNGGESSTC